MVLDIVMASINGIVYIMQWSPSSSIINKCISRTTYNQLKRNVEQCTVDLFWDDLNVYSRTSSQ